MSTESDAHTPFSLTTPDRVVLGATLTSHWAADRGDVVVVGHSFGGHAFGMTDAHERSLGLYTFATGAGWQGWMEPGERARVWALWNVVAPPLVTWHGYLPFRALGMGEDLPLGVYRDWKRWCRHPRYFFDNPEEGPAWAARRRRVVTTRGWARHPRRRSRHCRLA